MSRPKTQREEPKGAATAVQEPPAPAYDEGHVESVHSGVGQGVDEDPRTGEGKPAETEDQTPKHADQPDPFMSSEVAARIPRNTTS